MDPQDFGFLGPNPLDPQDFDFLDPDAQKYPRIQGVKYQPKTAKKYFFNPKTKSELLKKERV